MVYFHNVISLLLLLQVFFSTIFFLLFTECFAQDEKQLREMSPARVGTFQDTITEHWREDHDEERDEWMLAVVYLRQEGDGDPTKTVTFYRKKLNMFASPAWEKHNKKL